MAQQGTHAWFEERSGKLTASNLGFLLGLCTWKSRKQAYAQIRGGGYSAAEEDTPVPCLWGQRNEINALTEYSARTGNSVQASGCKVHPYIKWMGGSPDGLVGKAGIVEAKCPYNVVKGSRLHTTIPIYYYIQIIALIEIHDRQWCDYICWTPNEGCRIYHVSRDNVLFDYLLTHFSQIHAAFISGCDDIPKLQSGTKKEIVARVQQSMQEKIDHNFWLHLPCTEPPSLYEDEIQDGEGSDLSEEGGGRAEVRDGNESSPSKADRKRDREGEYEEDTGPFRQVCNEEVQVQEVCCNV